MINITFNSRAQARRDIPNLEGALILSFNDTESERVDMEELYANQRPEGSHLVTFVKADDNEGLSFEQCKLLMDAVDNVFYQGVYIHCWAGISRSGAVAVFLNDYLKLGIPRLSNYKNYNRAIYSSLVAYVNQNSDC